MYKNKTTIILLIGLFIATIDLFTYRLITKNYAPIIFWSILNIFGLIIIGYEKNRNIYLTDALQIVIIVPVTFIIFEYILGIILGFNISPYNLEIPRIIKNIFPIILLILTEELFRYIYIRRNNNKFDILLLIMLTSIITITTNL